MTYAATQMEEIQIVRCISQPRMRLSTRAIENMPTPQTKIVITAKEMPARERLASP